MWMLTLHWLAIVVVTDIAPKDWLPRLQSMLIIIYGVANVIGPLLGA